MRQQLPYKARPQIYAKAFRNNSRFSKIWSIRRFFIFSTKKSGLVYRIGVSSSRLQYSSYGLRHDNIRIAFHVGHNRKHYLRYLAKRKGASRLGQLPVLRSIFPCPERKRRKLMGAWVVKRPFPSHIPVSCLRYYAPNPTSLPLMSGCDPSPNRNGKSKNRVICIVLASISLLLFGISLKTST